MSSTDDAAIDHTRESDLAGATPRVLLAAWQKLARGIPRHERDDLLSLIKHVQAVADLDESIGMCTYAMQRETHHTLPWHKLNQTRANQRESRDLLLADLHRTFDDWAPYLIHVFPRPLMLPAPNTALNEEPLQRF